MFQTEDLGEPTFSQHNPINITLPGDEEKMPTRALELLLDAYVSIATNAEAASTKHAGTSQAKQYLQARITAFMERKVFK